MSEATLSGVWSKRAAGDGDPASVAAGSGSKPTSTRSAASSAAARLWGDDEGDGLSHVAHPIDRERVLEVAEQPLVGHEADGDGPERVHEITPP